MKKTNNLSAPSGVVRRSGRHMPPEYAWHVAWHEGDRTTCMASEAGARALATPVPDPVPDGLLRDLIQGAELTQGDAARALHVLPQTLRKWMAPDGASSKRAVPWASAELLRRMIAADELGQDG